MACNQAQPITTLLNNGLSAKHAMALVSKSTALGFMSPAAALATLAATSGRAASAAALADGSMMQRATNDP